MRKRYRRLLSRNCNNSHFWLRYEKVLDES